MAGPIANNDIYNATAGESKTLGLVFDFFGNTFDLSGLLKNDTDDDGDPLSIVAAEGQDLEDGSVTVMGDNGGAFTIYDDGGFYFDASTGFEYLAAGETAETTITYTVFDGTSTSQATVTVTVTGVDGDELAAINDTFTVQATDAASAPLDLLANDNQDIGLTLTSVNGSGDDIDQTISGSEGGLFVVTADGSMTFDANGEFEYLSEGESVTTSIEYTVTDINGQESTATVDVLVEGVNEGPTANDDSYSIDAGDKIVLGMERLSFSGDSRLLANDSDPDTNDNLSVITVDGQTMVDGEVTVSGDNGGLFTISSDGVVSFDAGNGDFDGLLRGTTIDTSVSYTIDDGHGGTDTANVSVTVTGDYVPPVTGGGGVGTFIPNEPPVAEDDFYSIDAGISLVLGMIRLLPDGDSRLIANDSDPEGYPLKVFSVNDEILVGETITVLGDNGGIFTIFEDGVVKFDASNGDFDLLPIGETAVSQVSYTVSDHLGRISQATVSVEILGQYELKAFDDEYSVVESPGLLSTLDINPLDNDNDPDVDPSINVISIDTSDLKGDLYDYGNSFSYNPGQEFEYLAEGESETTSFTYTIENADGASDTATVTITVIGQNDAPIAISDDGGDIDQNGSITIIIADLLENDSDVDNDSTISFVGLNTSSPGTSGSVVDNGDGTITYEANGAYDNLSEGTFGSDTFFYTIEDERGEQTNGSVNVSILGINDAPTAVDDATLSINENETLLIDSAYLIANDIDPDNGAILTVTGFDAPSSGSIVDNEDGTFRFDPLSDGSMALGESFTVTLTYNLTDEFGETSSASLDVVVNGLNDAPVATNNGVFSVSESDTLVIDIASSLMFDDTDIDAGALLTFDSVDTSSSPTSGEIAYDVNDGTLTYDPNGAFDMLNAGETGVDGFYYTIRDEFGEADSAYVTIEITGIDDPIV